MRITDFAVDSLIWDRRELAFAGEFKPCGPQLPVEFYRVLGDGHLTQVIDVAFDASCVTNYLAASAGSDFDTAIKNLRLREGLPSVKGIGFIDVVSGKKSDRTNATRKLWHQSRLGRNRTALKWRYGRRLLAISMKHTRRESRFWWKPLSRKA